MNLSRRDFLSVSLLAAMSAQARGLSFLAKHKLPLLILIELKGGNDFLSTLAPIGDSAYGKWRPTLQLQKNELDPINPSFGFHKGIPVFHELFQGNELAVIQGVGYSNPSFSHFRSLDIWESGSGAGTFSQDGWAARLLRNLDSSERPVDAIGIGATGMGPAKGLEKRGFSIFNPQRFRSDFSYQKIDDREKVGGAMAHILEVQKNANETFERIKALPNMNDINYVGDIFEVTVRVVNQLLKSMPTLPYLKFSHGNFDTHTDQRPTHDRLLVELNTGLTHLVAHLKQSGQWKDTLIVTYSEFGRAPMENSSFGTDHGSTSCQFVMGGRVKGGLYGTYPAFSTIKDFYYPHTLDYRSMFSTVIKDFWKLDPKVAFPERFETLGFIKA